MARKPRTVVRPPRGKHRPSRLEKPSQQSSEQALNSVTEAANETKPDANAKVAVDAMIAKLQRARTEIEEIMKTTSGETAELLQSLDAVQFAGSGSLEGSIDGEANGEPKLAQLWTVAKAAKECDVPVTTLRTAVKSGNVPGFHTADGLPLVLLEDVKKFKANPPKMGRPKITK